jgi:hypothetical protein
VSASDYAYLWDGSTDGRVPLRLDVAEGAGGHAIVNRITKRALLIEDDEIFEQVIATMLHRGCPVIAPGDLSGRDGSRT